MPICEEHVACGEAVQPASGAVAVIGLSRAQLQDNGRLLASTRACILVVSPPRERPMQSDRPSFFGVAAMLVHSDRGTVDHLDIALISLRYSLQYPRPVTCLAPAVDAVHTGLMRSVTGRDSAHGAPVRNRQNIPFTTRRSSTQGTPRTFVGSTGSITDHSKSVKSKRPFISLLSSRH